jgi:hypothetical protein
MACPYFCPTRRLEGPAWRSKVRPPLGDAYEGECHARPEQIHQPTREVLVEGCNLGYAAQHCKRFPAGEGPEAVRFCVRADSGAAVSLDYVLERAHLPYEHGHLVYDRGRKSWSGLPAGSLLERQAQTYLESYLSWKDAGGAGAERQTATAKPKKSKAARAG